MQRTETKSNKRKKFLKNFSLLSYWRIFLCIRYLLINHTMLLGCFKPIFYFNCEQILLVYIVTKKQTKIRVFYKENFVDFHYFQKLNFVKGNFLKIRSFINVPWGHRMSQTKFGPDRFSRFDGYWIQTNRKAKYIYRNKYWLKTYNVNF